MKVAVCDEDRESLARLRRMVKEQEPECEVVCFDSGRKFLEAGQHFDILLLEIQMAEISGLEVARALRAGRESTVLIFVTALKEYAPEAFELSATCSSPCPRRSSAGLSGMPAGKRWGTWPLEESRCFFGPEPGILPSTGRKSSMWRAEGERWTSTPRESAFRSMPP